jgi:hypothetical protein
MAKKNTSTPARPPGRPAVPGSLRRGAKYDLARTALKCEPIEWIEQRRAADFSHPDGWVGPMSFRALADEITDRMHKARIRNYVTIETVRAWYRAVHPTDGVQ